MIVSQEKENKKIVYFIRESSIKVGTVFHENVFTKSTEEFQIKIFDHIQPRQNYLYSEFNNNDDTEISNLKSLEQIVPKDKLKINISPFDFDYIKVIGKGFFGKVTKVKFKFDSQIYAMKTIKKSRFKEKKHLEQIKFERRILESIDHPFIISLKFAFQTPTKVYLTMEFCNGGELFYHIRKKGRFDLSETKFYFSQIVLAIGYLHSKKIMYRDLKPENLVLDNTGYIKLTDLGLAKDNFQEDSTTQTFCGTLEYLAPEIIRNEKYGKTVDIWCLGIILYEMLFGFPPFTDKNKEKLYKKIIYNETSFNQMASITISPEAKDLILKLLHKNPKMRPKINVIKEHPFFSNFNFDEILNKKVVPPFKPDNSSEFKFIDPILNNEKPEDSLYNGLSPLCEKNFDQFTYAKNFIGK